MTHAASLLVENLDLVDSLPQGFPVLDLACGSGRNGLYLARRNIPVTFADYDEDRLAVVSAILAKEGLPGKIWLVDLERPEADPLANRLFSAVMVFNYLHRPLFNKVKAAIVSGGLIYYETFTLDNRKFGRPRNPDFLLGFEELKQEFSDWDILHYFEGEQDNPNRAIANIIARKS